MLYRVAAFFLYTVLELTVLSREAVLLIYVPLLYCAKQFTK